MNASSKILHFLRYQKDLFALKLKLYALHQKIEESYLLLGEETYLFFKEESSGEIKEDGRVCYILEQIKKDNEMIFETEQEMCEISKKASTLWDRPEQPEKKNARSEQAEVVHEKEHAPLHTNNSSTTTAWARFLLSRLRALHTNNSSTTNNSENSPKEEAYAENTGHNEQAQETKKTKTETSSS